MFGLPVPAGRSAGNAGELILMGCLEPESPPQFQCVQGHQWREETEGIWQEALLAALRRHGYQDAGMSEVDAEKLARSVREVNKSEVLVKGSWGSFRVEVQTPNGTWTLYDEEDWDAWRSQINSE